jgi:hypothetical protein
MARPAAAHIPPPAEGGAGTHQGKPGGRLDRPDVSRLQPRTVDTRHLAPPAVPCAAGRWHGVLRRQRHAGHGRSLADGGTDGFFIPGRAGADGGLPADVPAGAAGWRAGRHHRPPAAHPGALARAGRHVCVLALLVLAGWAGAATLLLLTFLAGCCTALLSPSWNSPSSTWCRGPSCHRPSPRWHRLQRGPRAGTGGGRLGVRQRRQRLGLPAGGGWRAGAAGIGAPPPAAPAPAQPAAGRAPVGRHAQRAALRRHSETVLAQLVRTAAYSAAGSALWALLPVIGQRQLGLGAAGFGFLMGCLGAGAVADRLTIGPLRVRLGLERLVPLGCVAYAAVMAVAACRAGRCWSTPPCWRPAALDGRDVDLQHRHPDQRAALGARTRHRLHTCARWARLPSVRPSGARCPACSACRPR